MRCIHCPADLGKQETITSIQGVLMCNSCAVKKSTEAELLDLAEEVVPSDIGITPECEWCGEE